MAPFEVLLMWHSSGVISARAQTSVRPLLSFHSLGKLQCPCFHFTSSPSARLDSQVDLFSQLSNGKDATTAPVPVQLDLIFSPQTAGGVVFMVLLRRRTVMLCSVRCSLTRSLTHCSSSVRCPAPGSR